MMRDSISAEFPFKSNYINVLGSNMHYVDEGEGDPILFLHGNPSSSYLWRNIIPYVTDRGRVIAPDLIGMGKSDKPDSAYRFHDHYRYLAAFIDALDLTNITLVIHDWGSALGFHYANEHRDNVKAIAFMEGMLRPLSWSGFEFPFNLAFRMMRAPFIGWLMVSVANVFVKQIVPQAVVRELSSAEKAAYAAPFPTIASRKPVLQWPRDIPIDGTPADMHTIIASYSDWLQQTELPKLLFYAQPGATVTEDVVRWAKASFPNLRAVDIGDGMHFIQEDNPHLIGRELAAWIAALTDGAQMQDAAGVMEQ